MDRLVSSRRRRRGHVAMLCTTLAFVPAPAGADEPAPAIPPNIVLVIGDDHGYPDFGFMGSKIARTPNLDRLAAGGTVYRVGYNTASVCRPSLRTLLTGLHPYQWMQRVADLSESARRRSGAYEVLMFDTVPNRLAERGYRRYQDGKHWEGSYLDAGFSGGTKRFATGGPNPMSILGPNVGILARESMNHVFRFIQRAGDSHFFLWFAPMLPHVPFDAAPEFEEPYSELPDAIRGYYANISRFDAALGALLARLEEGGVLERTLVVYLSDNGWDPVTTPTDLAGDGPRGKTTLYEIGFRTPIILSWPGHVPAGRVSDDLVSTVDLVATLLDYAGASADGLPGRSLRPSLEDRAPWTQEWIAGVLPAGGPASDSMRGDARGRTASFVRDARWHYIALEDPAWEELYDVGSDPRETRDVAGEHPDVVALMRQRISTWKQEMTVAP